MNRHVALLGIVPRWLSYYLVGQADCHVDCYVRVAETALSKHIKSPILPAPRILQHQSWVGSYAKLLLLHHLSSLHSQSLWLALTISR